MVNIPDEDRIEAVVSEIKSHANEKTDSDHSDGCEFCFIHDEMNKRNELAKDQLCIIDKVILDLVNSNPALCQLAFAPMIGEGIQNTIGSIGRICFLIGLKVKETQYEAEKLKSMFPEI